MAQNKLKKKVEALTNVVRQLIKELQATTSLAQGTLTAFQMHIGKDDWEKMQVILIVTHFGVTIKTPPQKTYGT